MTPQRSTTLQYVNTVLLTILVAGVGVTIDIVSDFNEKIDLLSEKVIELETWRKYDYHPLKDRVIKLEAILSNNKNYNPIKNAKQDN